MSLYIDLALLAILLFFIIYNMIRGFVKALRPFRKVLAVIFAWTLRIHGARIVRAWLPDEKWEADIYNRIYYLFGDRVNQVSSSSGKVTADSYNGIFGTLENLFSNIKDVCAQAVNNGVEDVASTVASFVSANLVTIMVRGVAFLGLLVVFYIIFLILGIILEKVCSGANILGYINRGIGATMGLVIGTLIVWGVSLLLRLVAPGLVEQTIFVNWLCNEFILSSVFGLAIT